MEVKVKPIYKSKTYGFGAFLLLLGGAVLGLPELRAVVETLPVEYQGVILLVLGVLTMVFRQMTDGPTGIWGREPENEGVDYQGRDSDT